MNKYFLIANGSCIKKKNNDVISGVVATIAAFTMIATIYPIENQAFAQQQNQPIPFTVQNTSMSA